MTISPIGAQLYHADGQTYMTKLTVAFRNFAKSASKCLRFTLQADELSTGQTRPVSGLLARV